MDIVEWLLDTSLIAFYLTPEDFIKILESENLDIK